MSVVLSLSRSSHMMRALSRSAFVMRAVPTFPTRSRAAGSAFGSTFGSHQVRNMAYGLAKQGEGEEERYVPPYTLVVLEATGVVFKTGQEADFRVNGDVRDAIQCLKFDGVKTALVCTRDPPLSADSVKEREIGKHFNSLFTPGDVSSAGKGELSGLCDAMECSPSSSIYVGKDVEAAAKLGMRVLKTTGDQTETVKALEEACQTSLVNFAWTRDIYAGVLWKNSKDCTREDAAK